MSTEWKIKLKLNVIKMCFLTRKDRKRHTETYSEARLMWILDATIIFGHVIGSFWLNYVWKSVICCRLTLANIMAWFGCVGRQFIFSKRKNEIRWKGMRVRQISNEFYAVWIICSGNLYEFNPWREDLFQKGKIHAQSDTRNIRFLL